MKDFFKKIRNAGLIVANVTVMATMAAGYEVVRGTQGAVRRLTGKDNGMTEDVKDTAHIRLGAFKGAITIPPLSKADKKWARRMKRADSYEIAQELNDACLKGDNARVLHLINQPWRGGALFSRTTYGFNYANSMALDEALHVAAGANNVGALYLLLAFSEKNHRDLSDIEQPYRAEYIEERIVTGAFRALRTSGYSNAGDATRFLAEVIGDFSKAYRSSGECRDGYLAEAVQDLIRHKNIDLLDVLLQKGTRVETFIRAIDMTFDRDAFLSRAQIVSDDARRVFLTWAQDRKVVDAGFAASIEGKMKEEQQAIAAAKESGFYYMPASGNKRWFSRPDNQSLGEDAEVNYKRIDEEKVVATLRGRGSADSIALEFNFVTRKARVDGKDCSFEDFSWQTPVGGEIVAVAEQDWKEHQTLRRRLVPHVRAKVWKPDNNT